MFILCTVLFSVFLVTSCVSDDTIKEITIGNQVWMAENLNVDKFSNGDPILQAKTIEEWIKANEKHEPAWSYCENDPANGEKYGKLYNWYAVNDPRGLAPENWHVPTDEEWAILIDFLGGESVAGSKMKSTSGWKDDGNGNNNSGFSCLPGGSFGEYGGIGVGGFWWSSTQNDASSAWCRYLDYSLDRVGRYTSIKSSGFSVRCLKD